MTKNISINSIESKIYLLRGQKVMLDKDLAGLYAVPTKSLNLAVHRNIKRFPDDFMFRLSAKDYAALRFQIETSKKGRGGARYLPYAFTENGVAMLSSVLRSEKAIWMNIQIMRAFTQIKQIALTHKELSLKLKDLEQKVGKHDEDIHEIIKAIQQLVIQEQKPKRRIGFHAD